MAASPAAAPPTNVRDPICGMELTIAQALAHRNLGGTTCYFCSESCASQFDRQHAASATTGVSNAAGLRWIDLRLARVDGRAQHILGEQLASVPGVQKVAVNPAEQLVRVQYDPTLTNLNRLVGRAQSTGYLVGTATMELGLAGLHCGSCVVPIEHSLGQTRGVVDVAVNPATERVWVEYVPGMIDLAGVTKAIE